jgi:hypothetical protein
MEFHQQLFFRFIILDLDPAIDFNSELQITGKRCQLLFEKQILIHAVQETIKLPRFFLFCHSVLSIQENVRKISEY